MEKSIESIWTKGFLKEEDLVAPKINNLYQRKSSLLIEKLKRTYKADNKSILPLAALSIIGFGFFGHLPTGLYVMSLLIGMFFLNKKKLESLERISINSTSYNYLLEYRKMFMQIKSFYTRLLGIGLPLAGLIGFSLFFWDSPALQEFLQLKAFQITGILLALSLVLSGIGILSYRLSLSLIYGSFVQKLEEMISDMKELQK